MRLPCPVLCSLAALVSALSMPAAARTQPASPAAAWVALYKHDGNGRALAGDKQALVDAVRRGENVRVSWGARHPRDSTRTVEHTALAVFTTVVDGAELFVQVAEHVAFADYWARDGQAPGDPRITWAGVLGTTGTFNALWYDRARGAEMRRFPQRVTMTWFVQRAAHAADARGPRDVTRRPPPLWSTEPALP